jgi:flagellar hook-associated protein 1 FlgK
MSDLLSLLSLGSSAMAAQNSGVATASNNVANANTEGYSRERVVLESLIGPPLDGGVRSGATTRLASDLLSGRIRTADATLARSQTSANALADLETTLTPGPSITDRLTAVFSRLNQVSASPTDTNLRDAAVASLGDLVTSIHTAAGQVADAQTAGDQQITDVTTQATSLATQLAAANKAVQTSTDPTAADRRDLLANQLAQLVGGKARIDPDGQLRFVLDGGAVLVDGDHAAALAVAKGPAAGQLAVNFVDGATTRDVTAALAGGQLGGALAVRTQLTALAGQYDQYAYDVAAGFNAVSVANAGLDGVSGRTMFTPIATVAGAATAIAVDPGLVASSDQLATAAVGAGPGNNAGALALYGLASQQVASGGTRTLSDASLDIATGLAQQVSTAKTDAQTDQVVASHLGDLRDSLSGVDLVEEQTNLSRFANASAAATKFVATINQMLTDLMHNL